MSPLTWTCLALAPLALAMAGATVLLALRFGRYVRHELARTPVRYTPPVSVILPCKGVDPDFEQSVRAVLEQDYPDYEVIFATATEDDAACPPLRQLIAGHDASAGAAGAGAAKLVYAGLPSERSQKVNNQLAALAAVRAESQVLVFLDSDGQPDAGFLRRLVEPLHDAAVGAATGFRWYVPPGGRFGAWLRSVWNAGGLPFLAHPKLNYTFGGAMAVRRDTFEQLDVAGAWAHTLSDDITLTRVLRQAGRPIHFVPTCIVICQDDATLAQTIEWTTRQTVVARVYMPAFWLGSGLTHAMTLLLAALGAAQLVTVGLASGPQPAWAAPAGAAMLAPLLGMYVMAALLVPILPRLLPGTYGPRLRRRAGLYLLLAPVASLLLLWNTVHSSLSRRIRWRGIVYDIHSPDRIVQVT